MSQRGYTPLDTPVCPVRHDRRRTDADKQFVEPKKTRNKHGIHKHPNQQGERVG